jgi:WD40 repeat protein
MHCRRFGITAILITLAIGSAAHAQPGITRTTQFSVDGKIIASSSTTVIDIWDVADGRLLRQLQGHSDHVNALAFTPDGRTLASGSYDGSVRLWDARGGKELHVLKGLKEAIAYIAVSADGKLVAAGGYDNLIWIWDIATGKEQRRLAGSQGAILGLAFSPDGKMLASCGIEHVIRLWDVATGKEIRQLTGNKHNVRTFAFTSNSKFGISGGCDHSVRFWDVTTGKEVRQFAGHGGDVFFVALSPDGKTLATGSHDGSIRLWDVASGGETRRCTGHDGGVICLSFSPDGRTLTSGGYDKVQRISEIATGVERLRFGGANAAAPNPVPNLAPLDVHKGLWSDLASEDGHVAHRAIWTLARSAKGVAFLRENLQPKAEAPFDNRQAKRWIEELGHDQFKVREKAFDGLAKLGPAVVPLLKATLSGQPEAETRRRIERLLASFAGAEPAAQAAREARVVEVLEHAATKDAIALLRTLAEEGDGETTRQARLALARLARQSKND